MRFIWLLVALCFSFIPLAHAQVPLMQPILEGDPALVRPETSEIPPSEDMLESETETPATEEAPETSSMEDILEEAATLTDESEEEADFTEMLIWDEGDPASDIKDITDDESFVFDEDVELKDYPYVKLRALDKVTARTTTLEAQVNVPIRFGQIYMKPQACRKPPPLEKPEAATFLQIWETDIKGVPQWAFSGWMYASSPALSAMDHPIYDVWVLDCLEKRSEEGKLHNEIN